MPNPSIVESALAAAKAAVTNPTESKKKIDLDKDFKASGLRLLELKKGRHVDDIPLNDEYWVALKNHNLHHGVHS